LIKKKGWRRGAVRVVRGGRDFPRVALAVAQTWRPSVCWFAGRTVVLQTATRGMPLSGPKRCRTVPRCDPPGATVPGDAGPATPPLMRAALPRASGQPVPEDAGRGAGGPARGGRVTRRRG